jgi:excisionase family DNA binding protein
MNARRPTTSMTLELVATGGPAQPSRRAPAGFEHQIVDVTVQPDERLLLSVDEAAHRLSIGRSLLYELLAAGEIRSIHFGRLRRVPIAALTDYINRQAPEQPATVTAAT